MSTEKRIIKEINQELKKHIDHEYRDSVQKFTKKEDRNNRVTHYGVKTPIVRKNNTNSVNKSFLKGKICQSSKGRLVFRNTIFR